MAARCDLKGAQVLCTLVESCLDYDHVENSADRSFYHRQAAHGTSCRTLQFFVKRCSQSTAALPIPSCPPSKMVTRALPAVRRRWISRPSAVSSAQSDACLWLKRPKPPPSLSSWISASGTVGRPAARATELNASIEWRMGTDPVWPSSTRRGCLAAGPAAPA